MYELLLSATEPDGIIKAIIVKTINTTSNETTVLFGFNKKEIKENILNYLSAASPPFPCFFPSGGLLRCQPSLASQGLRSKAACFLSLPLLRKGVGRSRPAYAAVGRAASYQRSRLLRWACVRSRRLLPCGATRRLLPACETSSRREGNQPKGGAAYLRSKGLPVSLPACETSSLASLGTNLAKLGKGCSFPLPCEAREGRGCFTDNRSCFFPSGGLLRCQPEGCFASRREGCFLRSKANRRVASYQRSRLLRWGCVLP